VRRALKHPAAIVPRGGAEARLGDAKTVYAILR